MSIENTKNANKIFSYSFCNIYCQIVLHNGVQLNDDIFIFLVPWQRKAAFREVIAAHSVYDMFHGLSTWLLVWFFPTSVFGVGIFFWLRLFLIFAYLYLSMTLRSARERFLWNTVACIVNSYKALNNCVCLMQLAPELWNGCWVQVYCILRKHAQCNIQRYFEH